MQTRLTTKKTGIKKFFVVESIDDVAKYMKLNYDTVKKATPTTRDFTSMYTSLDQEAVIEGVCWCVEQAFENKGNKYLARDASAKRRKKKHFKWKEGKDDKKVRAYTSDEVKQLVRLAVENSFVKNGDYILHQKKGIPTGGNASPDLANLYCASKEMRYLDTLPPQQQKKVWRVFPVH